MIIKAVLFSPLLLFLRLLENGEQGLYQPRRNPGNPCSLIWCLLFLWLVRESLVMGAGTCLVKISREERDCPIFYFYLFIFTFCAEKKKHRYVCNLIIINILCVDLVNDGEGQWDVIFWD